MYKKSFLKKINTTSNNKINLLVEIFPKDIILIIFDYLKNDMFFKIPKKILNNGFNINKKNYSLDFINKYNINLGGVIPTKIFVCKTNSRSKHNIVVKLKVNKNIKNIIKTLEQECRELLLINVKSIAGGDYIYAKLNQQTYEYNDLNEHVPYMFGVSGTEGNEISKFNVKGLHFNKMLEINTLTYSFGVCIERIIIDKKIGKLSAVLKVL